MVLQSLDSPCTHLFDLVRATPPWKRTGTSLCSLPLCLRDGMNPPGFTDCCPDMGDSPSSRRLHHLRSLILSIYANRLERPQVQRPTSIPRSLRAMARSPVLGLRKTCRCLGFGRVRQQSRWPQISLQFSQCVFSQTRLHPKAGSFSQGPCWCRCVVTILI